MKGTGNYPREIVVLHSVDNALISYVVHVEPCIICGNNVVLVNATIYTENPPAKTADFPLSGDLVAGDPVCDVCRLGPKITPGAAR